MLANMVRGVSEGYKLTMDMYGVGYRAAVAGDLLTLNLGLSHQVIHPLHPAVKVKVEIIDEGGTKRPRLHIESFDKEALGATASKIRSYRPPEPYKGKGVRYTGERVREKAGKAGGK
jgi:large subunit ribosomal protein L6